MMTLNEIMRCVSLDMQDDGKSMDEIFYARSVIYYMDNREVPQSFSEWGDDVDF